MYGGRKSSVKVVSRGNRSFFKFARDTRAGRRTSYIITTPARRLSKHRISTIRRSATLRRALRRRRASQRAVGVPLLSARGIMYRREAAAIRRSRKAHRKVSRKVHRKSSKSRKVSKIARHRIKFGKWAKARCVGVPHPCTSKNWKSFKSFRGGAEESSTY